MDDAVTTATTNNTILYGNLLLILFIRDNFILRRTLLICAKLVSGQPMPLKLLRT